MAVKEAGSVSNKCSDLHLKGGSCSLRFQGQDTFTTDLAICEIEKQS